MRADHLEGHTTAGPVEWRPAGFVVATLDGEATRLIVAMCSCGELDLVPVPDLDDRARPHIVAHPRDPKIDI